MEKPINRQELVNYKNKLYEQSREYYDWASINENKAEELKELAVSEKLKQIADDLNKMLYD
jgi:hypothetical protein